MIANARFRPSHATIVAYLALFVALGGTAYAATSLPANSVSTKQLVNGAVSTAKLHNQAVTAAKIANHSLTGTQIDVATLGTVPNAAQLAGAPASAYLSRCPSGLLRVPNGNLCFDANTRRSANWFDALNTCALAGLHLPDTGELTAAFNHLSAPQDAQWTSDMTYTGSLSALSVFEDDGRAIIPTFLEPKLSLIPYRCVTYASN